MYIYIHTSKFLNLRKNERKGERYARYRFSQSVEGHLTEDKRDQESGEGGREGRREVEREGEREEERESNSKYV